MKFLAAIWALIVLAIAIVAVGYVMAIFYVDWMYKSLGSLEKFSLLGPFGDFLGGTLNPLLTFLTFIAVVITIILQNRELALTRAEVERSANALDKQANSIELQNFENTFFEMLKFQADLVNSIDIDEGKIRGRDCFGIFYTNLNKKYRENLKKDGGKRTNIKVLALSYYLFWKEHQYDLGHYFRYLYNFLKFIDEKEGDSEKYIKILRSQLSDQELLILFYNCLSRNGEKFLPLAEKYALFDNLPTYRILDKEHLEFVNGGAFGSNQMVTNPRKDGQMF